MPMKEISWNVFLPYEEKHDKLSFQLSKSLQIMNVLGTEKRKALVDHNDDEMFSASKRREILEAGNEDIEYMEMEDVHVLPGNSNTDGIQNVNEENNDVDDLAKDHPKLA
ncbi:hypothetical protein V6N12_069695 [Hibiscus sabdariffa]|uniref:Uncharacterized protein n=1 Tax=Hibiscus sabdariffa TaxID=183260 RepID=A0ABR2FF21_9ROSI